MSPSRNSRCIYLKTAKVTHRLVLAACCALLALTARAQDVVTDDLSDFHLTAEVPPDPNSGGWQVDPRLGQLAVAIPTIQMPGEIAFPVSLNILGLPSVHYVQVTTLALVNNHDIPVYTTHNQAMTRPLSSYFNLGYIDQASGTPVYRLEDGRQYDPFQFTEISGAFSVASLGNLFTAFFKAAPPSSWSTTPPQVSADGKMVLFSGMYYASKPSNPGYPTLLFNGNSIFNSDALVLMDKDRARVFQKWSGVYVPVLILDRFGHYVSFTWTCSGDLTRVDVRNQRNQGFTVRQRIPSRGATGLQDLARLDFVNISGPSVLVQGDSTVRYCTNCAPPDSPAPTVLVGIPQTVTVGDPSVVPQPTWSNQDGTASAPPTTNPLEQTAPPAKVWTFTCANGGIQSMTDPLGVQTTFTTTTYSVALPNGALYGYAPDLVTGVVQAAQVDGSGKSSATRTRTWTRSFAANLITVQYTDVWGSGAPDRTLTATYGGSVRDYGNGYLSGWALADASGNSLASVARPSASGAGVDGGRILSWPQSETWTRAQQATRQSVYTYDATCHVLLSSRQDLVGGAPAQTRAYTYAPRWDMLDGPEVTRVVSTRTQFPSGTTLAPVTSLMAWTQDLQVAQTSRSDANGSQHGGQYTYDTAGRLSIQAILHTVGGTPADSPRHMTITYDDAVTGLPTRWATTYQDLNGTSSFYKAQGAFDPALRPTQAVDERGVATTTQWDLLGRPLTIQKDGEAAITISYPDFCTKVSHQAAKTTTEITDGFGRLIQRTLPDGRRQQFTYDLHGRLAQTSETNPAGGTRTQGTSYDLLDRVVTQTDFDGKTTTYAYSTDGVLDTVTATLPKVTPPLSTVTSRDCFGQVVLVQAPNGDVTRTAFDGWGNRISIARTPGSGGVTQIRTFSYDGLGRLVQKTEPETGTQTFTNFDSLNLPRTITEGAQSTVPRTRTCWYDGLGRLRSQTSGTTSETFTYTGVQLTGTSRAVGNDQVTQAFTYGGPGARLSLESTIANVTGAW